MSRKPIFNVEDSEFRTFAARGRFEAQMARMAGEMGAKRLGFNVTRLAPGKISFPYHFHHVLEELFLVLEGNGTLRYDGDEYSLRPGDLVCCPPGPDSAHQIINDSDSDLVYLAVSSADTPDIVEYPDSGKYAVSHRPDPNDPAPAFRKLGLSDTQIDYFEGEEFANEDGE